MTFAAAWALAKAFGKGAWGILRAIPWQAWLVAALLLAGWRYGEHRAEQATTACDARWEAAQAEADRQAEEAAAQRDAAASAVNTATTERAHEATIETRTETATAVERVRYETRTIEVPANCPVGLPVRVRDEGRAAVDRARAAGNPLRTGRNP